MIPCPCPICITVGGVAAAILWVKNKKNDEEHKCNGECSHNHEEVKND